MKIFLNKNLYALLTGFCYERVRQSGVSLNNERTGDLYNDEVNWNRLTSADYLEDGGDDCDAINAVKEHGGFDDDVDDGGDDDDDANWYELITLRTVMTTVMPWMQWKSTGALMMM